MPYTYENTAICLTHYSASNRLITITEFCDKLGHACFQLCSNHLVQTFSLLEDLIHYLNILACHSQVISGSTQLIADIQEALAYIELRNNKLQF